MINNKGAMFGLDARIALAIFGALSVISGAALYSAIQESRIKALLAEVKEAGKAYEQYFLDVGERPAVAASSGNGSSLVYLTSLNNDPSKTGWSGPYLSYSSKHPIYKGDVYFLYAKDMDWGAGHADQWNTALCTTGDDCHVWIHFNGLPVGYAKALDERVDGEVNSHQGNLRSTVYLAKDTISYKLFPLQK